jgi:hypothetical protein
MLSTDIKSSALNIIMEVKFETTDNNIEITYGGVVTKYNYGSLHNDPSDITLGGYHHSYDLKENKITANIVAMLMYSREEYIRKLILEDRILDDELMRIYEKTITNFMVVINDVDTAMVNIERAVTKEGVYKVTITSNYIKVTINMLLSRTNQDEVIQVSHTSLIEALYTDLKSVQINEQTCQINKDFIEEHNIDTDEELINSFIIYGKVSKYLLRRMHQFRNDIRAKE